MSNKPPKELKENTIFETSTKYYQKDTDGNITERYIDIFPKIGLYYQVQPPEGNTVSYTKDGEYRIAIDYRWCIAFESIEGTPDVRGKKIVCLIPNI